MAPTLIQGVGWQDAVMQEEIFGPILPVIEYTELTEAIALVNAKPKPLALYFFSTDKQKQQRVLHQTSSGGACINDTVMHLAVLDLPFGGVGESGIGRYHGKAGFDTFSHQKSVLNKSFLVDVKLRYAPYLGKLKLLKSLIK
jgi:acyl-CoA reductase-like NAD-dependent aldehyde dehydrogenase